MADGFLKAMKFAAMGTVAGVAAAYVTDQINTVVLNPIIAPSSTTASSQMSIMGRLAFQSVATAALAGGVIYGGDQLMLYLGEDSLYHLFYYNIAISTGFTVAQSVRSTVTLLNMISQAIYPPPSAPATTGAGTSCGTSSCGAK